jgi:hypothetical protein
MFSDAQRTALFHHTSSVLALALALTASALEPFPLVLRGRFAVFDLTGGNLHHQLGGLAEVSGALGSAGHLE